MRVLKNFVKIFYVNIGCDQLGTSHRHLGPAIPRGPSGANKAPRRKRAISGSTALMRPAPSCTRRPGSSRCCG